MVTAPLQEGQTLFPVLRYEDARAAIRWLGEAFGFRELFSVPPSGDVVQHARVELGGAVVMLGSVRPGEDLRPPAGLGCATQALCILVPDVEAHFGRARAAGAEIVQPLTDTDFGVRLYSAVDLEGHPWTFSSFPSAPAG
jgi:uncharacterized glyoxalase superfamily protein PhnB